MARFLHLSDLHVVAEGTLASGVLDTRSILTAAVDRLLEMRAAIDPLDAVLITGDISDDGSEDSYAFAVAELARLGLPVFVVPGNHDARGAFRAAFAAQPSMPATGLIDWSETFGETLVIGLDTLIEGQGGGILRPESLSFLSEALARQNTGPTVLMLHHPPIQTGIRFMDAIGLENATLLDSVLKEAQTEVTVLAGHVHGVYFRSVRGHRVMTAPSICSAFALDRRAGARVGFQSGPTGCALLDTGPDGHWTVLPLEPSSGTHPF